MGWMSCFAKLRMLRCERRAIADACLQMNPESRIMLPKMAFTGFASRYREPTLNEGFEDITRVDFKVSRKNAVEADGQGRAS